ncbi:MAG: hypothetical protein Q9209_002432 [Squamulea sp. 1 TL-2023]
MVYDLGLSFEEAYAISYGPLTLFNANDVTAINIGLNYYEPTNGTVYYKYDVQYSTVDNLDLACDVTKNTTQLCCASLIMTIPRFARTVQTQETSMHWLTMTLLTSLHNHEDFETHLLKPIPYKFTADPTLEDHPHYLPASSDNSRHLQAYGAFYIKDIQQGIQNQAMPSSRSQYADISNKLHSACTFPASDSLDDHTCCICQEPSLERNGAEVPVKLACGHVFGFACILKWTFNKIDSGSTAPQCPQCRTPFLEYDAPAQEGLLADNDGLHIRGAARRSRYRRHQSPLERIDAEIEAELHELGDMIESRLASLRRHDTRRRDEDIVAANENASLRRRSHFFAQDIDPPSPHRRNAHGTADIHALARLVDDDMLAMPVWGRLARQVEVDADALLRRYDARRHSRLFEDDFAAPNLSTRVSRTSSRFEERALSRSDTERL